VAEGVEIERCGRGNVELLGEIAPAKQDLSHERLARGHITVRLQVPATHDVPAAFPREALDAGE
jgi:hypothetical protein